MARISKRKVVVQWARDRQRENPDVWFRNYEEVADKIRQDTGVSVAYSDVYGTANANRDWFPTIRGTQTHRVASTIRSVVLDEEASGERQQLFRDLLRQMVDAVGKYESGRFLRISRDLVPLLLKSCCGIPHQCLEERIEMATSYLESLTSSAAEVLAEHQPEQCDDQQTGEPQSSAGIDLNQVLAVCRAISESIAAIEVRIDQLEVSNRRIESAIEKTASDADAVFRHLCEECDTTVPTNGQYRQG